MNDQDSFPTDILVISAHPDDAEFGVAGTVARWTAEGKRVVYLLCTSGEKGTSDPDMTPERLAGIREDEQRHAAARVGVEHVEFMRYPDQGLEDTSEFRKHIVRMLRMFRPEIVVTSDPYRRYVWHRDHRILGQVVLDAVFPFARDRLAYPDLLKEGFLPHKVKEILFWGADEVNYRLNISETFDRKLAALQCHESQVRELPIPDLEGWLKHRCQEMAKGMDFELAEAFYRVELPA